MGVLGRHQEGVQRRRQRDTQDNRTEKAGAKRKDNREICSRVQKSSQRKWI